MSYQALKFLFITISISDIVFIYMSTIIWNLFLFPVYILSLESNIKTQMKLLQFTVNFF